MSAKQTGSLLEYFARFSHLVYRVPEGILPDLAVTGAFIRGLSPECRDALMSPYLETVRGVMDILSAVAAFVRPTDPEVDRVQVKRDNHRHRNKRRSNV